MSLLREADNLKTANRELLDRLAAEYVLGTLRFRARKRFERWLLSPQVGALVTAWEERLAGLEPPLKSIAPPATVWRGIENRLELRKLGRATPMRYLAIAASLLFFAALGIVAVHNFDGGAIEQPPVQLAATQKAFIEENAETIYWRIELLGDNQAISMHVHKVHELPPGKSFELWALTASGAPVSLGLMPVTGDGQHALSAAQRTALVGAKQIAVSLEPAGGSPTGLPTGPVLHVAPLQAV
jgi:anti-sigma-K factor RskA